MTTMADGAANTANRPEVSERPWTPSFTGGANPRLSLSIAVSEYDHVHDLTSGAIEADGISLTTLPLMLEEIFFRFTRYREWEVSEISFAKYASLISQGDCTLTAIPVFPSRMFRHSSIYVRRDGPVRVPADLAGKRVGLPEWAQTASVYSRGFLVHQFGVPLTSIDWVQAGVNQAGRREKVAIRLPEGVRYTSRPDTSLNAMLLAGEVDAVLSAHPPQAFEDGHPGIVRLIDDYRPVEEAHFRETGIFPIMHTIAIRAEVVARFPWVPMNLYKAFEAAKDRSVARSLEITASRFPIPWMQNVATDGQKLFGEDLWPYGIEPNRKTLEAFLAYAYEHGVCHRHLRPEELFAPEVLSAVRV